MKGNTAAMFVSRQAASSCSQAEIARSESRFKLPAMGVRSAMHNVPTATAEAAIDESVWDRAIKGKVSGSGRRGDASRPF